MIQILALGILLLLSFFIVKPFITLLIWGGVLAITFGPLHRLLTKQLKIRPGLSAGIIVLGLLMVIILPAILIMLSTVDEFKALISTFQSNDLHIPPPYDGISQFPIIGPYLYSVWEEASLNLSETFIKHQDEIKPVLIEFLGMVSHTASGIFTFTLSILVSGVFMAYSVEEGQYARKFFTKLAGKSGERMADDARTTVINVVKGILGVSIIQALFCGLGMFIAGIPFTGIWILVSLILSVFQIGLFPVSIGVIIYIWMNGSLGMAIFLTVWMVFAGLLDNFLKPMILGKGAPVPSMVVFMGAFGGFLYSGILGLFTGAIILTFAYTLTMSWLEEAS
ncbi:AI-2E family transporter [Cyclobacterium xiamenense]|uniref:AI-2E family transporter n=1 Tax=Cyclobacterium xiamenense TaxID=1297121 RepID=UPI001FD5BB3A|nr:AI-2E family transporter [Cyclobacterium xiamenense]